MNPDLKSSSTTDVIAALMQTGGHREAPPENAYQVVLAAAEEALQQKLQRRRLFRVACVLAAAAALGLLAVALFYAVPRLDAPAIAVQVATVDRFTGDVETRQSAGEDWTRVEASGADLRGGSMLRTGPDSGAGLAIERLSLRVGGNSEIGLVNRTQIRLVHGVIYVDTGARASDRLVVETPLGSAVHEGTQFQLAYDRSSLRLFVREGRVKIDREAGPIVAEAGEGLVIPRSGAVTRSLVTPFDPMWQWTESLAPMLDIEGKRATDLLTWVARQTGRELRYVSSAAEQRAGTIILHGHLRQLTPREALNVTLATTDLDAEVQEEGRILVGLH